MINSSTYRIIWIISVTFIFSKEVFASDYILKIAASSSHKELLSCIDKSEKDISFCIPELTSYLRSENKFIKNTLESTEARSRRSNIIDFLKRSADKFDEKAKSSNKLIYFEKAHKTMSVLVALSNDYAGYKNRIAEIEKRQDIDNVSIKLDVRFRTLSTYQPTSMEHNKLYEEYVNTVIRHFENLSNNTKDQAIAYAHDVAEKYRVRLINLIENISNNVIADFSGIEELDRAWQLAITTPRFSDRKQNIQELKHKIRDVISSEYIILNQIKDSIRGEFLTKSIDDLGEDLLVRVKEQIAKDETHFVNHRIASQHAVLFPQVTIMLVDQVAEHKIFYDFIFYSIESYIHARGNDFVKAFSGIYASAPEITDSDVKMKSKENAIVVFNNFRNYVRLYSSTNSDGVAYDIILDCLQTPVIKEWSQEILALFELELETVANRDLKNSDYLSALRRNYQSIITTDPKVNSRIEMVREELTNRILSHLRKAVEQEINKEEYLAANSFLEPILNDMPAGGAKENIIKIQQTLDQKWVKALLKTKKGQFIYAACEDAIDNSTLSSAALFLAPSDKPKAKNMLKLVKETTCSCWVKQVGIADPPFPLLYALREHLRSPEEETSHGVVALGVGILKNCSK